MRSPHIRVTAMLLAAAILATGCEDDATRTLDEQSASTASVGDHADKPAGASKEKKAPKGKKADAPKDKKADAARDDLREVYRSILANPSQVPAQFPDHMATPNGSYQYTLSDVDGDGRPDLLLSMGSLRGGSEDLSYLAIIWGTSTDDSLAIDPSRLELGASGVGGYRADVLVPEEGKKGVAHVEWQSIGGVLTATTFTRNGESLTRALRFEQDRNTQTVPGFCAAHWLPVSDSSLIDTLIPPGCSTPTTPTSVPPGSIPPPPTEKIPVMGGKPQPAAQPPAATGSAQTLAGTVRSYTAAQMNMTPANHEDPTLTYIVLDFDAPQALTCRQSGAPGNSTREETQLFFPNTAWTSHVGEHVTIALRPDQCWYPSDTSMPLGMVRTSRGTDIMR